MGNVWTHIGAGLGGFVLGFAGGWMANDMDRQNQAQQQGANGKPAAK
jgi:hypothetical protein